MKSDAWLSIALLLALCSNATLLLILLYNIISVDGGAGRAAGGGVTGARDGCGQKSQLQHLTQPRVPHTHKDQQDERWVGSLPVQDTVPGARPSPGLLHLPPDAFRQTQGSPPSPGDAGANKGRSIITSKNGGTHLQEHNKSFKRQATPEADDADNGARDSQATLTESAAAYHRYLIEEIRSRSLPATLRSPQGTPGGLRRKLAPLFVSDKLYENLSALFVSQSQDGTSPSDSRRSVLRAFFRDANNHNKNDRKINNNNNNSNNIGSDDNEALQHSGTKPNTNSPLKKANSYGDFRVMPPSFNERRNPRNSTTQARKAVTDAENLPYQVETPDKIRKKRQATIKVEATASYLNFGKIFSTFTDEQMANFSDSVSNILLPGLIFFEDNVVRELEDMHFLSLSHDLRLERAERALLNMAGLREAGGRRRGDLMLEPPQSEDLDRLAENMGPDYIWQSVEDGDSSGDTDLNTTTGTASTSTSTSTSTTSTTSTTTTTTTTRRPTQPMVYYDLMRDMSVMEQKVLALENYNTMSDSELNRVRSEVTKMDDKVIEMARKQKNGRAITSMHTYRITELEMHMSRNDVAINTAMDAYGRLNGRVETFKDRLQDFERDVHAVTVQFSRQEQISEELRSADSYKAHDIQELRKTMMGVESRLNDLYSQMDQNMDSIRGDFRNWLDRLCYNNKLAC